VSRRVAYRLGDIRFSQRELKDFAIAWLALGVAFTFFLNPGLIQALQYGNIRLAALTQALVLSMITVGTGFLLHELAHKVVAIRFGQIAEFRADYGMLGLAVVAGLAGFLFAAPGAVHHRGRISVRENGIIALAGPLVNVGLAAVFFAVGLVGTGFVAAVGSIGFIINALLAGFNMIPFGPLDGRTVLDWSPLVFAVVFVPTAGLGVWLLFGGLF
jgi:Zn-dependent protease